MKPNYEWEASTQPNLSLITYLATAELVACTSGGWGRQPST